MSHEDDKSIVKGVESTGEKVVNDLESKVGRIVTQVRELEVKLRDICKDSNPSAVEEIKEDRETHGKLFSFIAVQSLTLQQTSEELDDLLNRLLI